MSADQLVAKIISKFNSDVYVCGSGFCVSNDGHVITSAHNIGQPNDTHVYYKNACYNARLVCSDKRLDIALLKINCATVACEIDANARYGRCYTFGFNYDDTCISYQDGSICTLTYNKEGAVDSLVTTLRARKGCSGSPIFVPTGKVVGIVNWHSDKVGAGGVVFRLALPCIKHMVAYEKPMIKGYIPVDTEQLSIHDILFNKLDMILNNVRGVIVKSSSINNIHANDIILSINDTPVGNNLISFESACFGFRVGECVRLELLKHSDNYSSVHKTECVITTYPVLLDKPLHNMSSLVLAG